MRSINLTNLTSLQSIANNAFYYMGLGSANSSYRAPLNLSGLKNLKSIGRYVFDSCCSYTATKLDLSGCSSLTTIGQNAFGEIGKSCPDFIGIDLSGCNKLTTIGLYAFYNIGLNSPKVINPILPTSITTISKGAF